MVAVFGVIDLELGNVAYLADLALGEDGDIGEVHHLLRCRDMDAYAVNGAFGGHSVASEAVTLVPHGGHEDIFNARRVVDRQMALVEAVDVRDLDLVRGQPLLPEIQRALQPRKQYLAGLVRAALAVDSCLRLWERGHHWRRAAVGIRLIQVIDRLGAVEEHR